ncbi:unnamed protein product [Oppiella nova]|uniref:Uncharacterized protein n=1 Tax=Oppiella nova TaxID=334625 RepID=A0A7R9M316_9ACAR|nr:unnamed protein product [Oppiella nova]CAG2169715.1 unnamed protein product [Oppiella nova]
MDTQNKIIEFQSDRIEELEEALRESVRITAHKEYEMEGKDLCLQRAEQQVEKLMSDMRAMNKVANATCTNCPQLKVYLDQIEGRLKKLLVERNQHLNEMFDMKLEGLSAAISEKDAHLAQLEMCGIRNADNAREADRLRAQKTILVDRLKLENENRVKLLYDTKEILMEIQRTTPTNNTSHNNSHNKSNHRTREQHKISL